MSRERRCLSIQQPHADFIIHGEKWCENRSWRTHYRGELWIHASSRWDVRTRDFYLERGMDLAKLSPGGCQTGAIIGRVQLLDCIPIEELDVWQDGELSVWCEQHEKFFRSRSETSWGYCYGPWCWVLAEPEPLDEPVPMAGKLGLWKLGGRARNGKETLPHLPRA